jgi:hypothetical protein
LEEIIISSYTPKPEIIFVDEVADFRMFVSGKDQPNHDGISGPVLLNLNGIRDQKQFRIKRALGIDGHPKTEFFAKHLSSTADWGTSVDFLRYIPTSTMWVAPQMALKSMSGNGGNDEKEADSDNEDDTTQIHSRVLSKYQKAIIEQGFHYFGDEDKLWWVKFFGKQEEIIRSYLEPAQWRFEWTWPAHRRSTENTPDELQLVVPDHLLEKVTGPRRFMYSGRRRAAPTFGDYRDLEVNTKFAMICVKASADPMKRPFWVAKVSQILSHVGDVPENLRIIWYTMDSDEPALEGKYSPEKSKSSRKFLEDEIILSETTVYAYNFALLANRGLTTATKRLIRTAMEVDTEKGN